MYIVCQPNANMFQINSFNFTFRFFREITTFNVIDNKELNLFTMVKYISILNISLKKKIGLVILTFEKNSLLV